MSSKKRPSSIERLNGRDTERERQIQRDGKKSLPRRRSSGAKAMVALSNITRKTADKAWLHFFFLFFGPFIVIYVAGLAS